ncbi:MAG: chromosomal replication initiator protein DnaA [Lactobacillales bacterium]|jgi:chromosomal replication initiator protein|nr:chromosomal replication initiator protein DnaA [Lactobacillales bacterium]
MTDMNSIWDGFLHYLTEEVQLSKPSMDTFVHTSEPLGLNGNVLTILVASELHKNYWQTKLQNYVVAAGFAATGQEIIPKIVTQKEIEANVPMVSESPAEFSVDRKNQSHSKLNDKYTFDTFVIGKGNQMAHAAALVVADEPGMMYNPLFLYGGVGLGKTHLMHAIGHQMLTTNPNAKIKYVPAETFVNELIESISSKTTGDFRESYRNVDLLLVDDIQFFAKKGSTQEEFFNTFEALFNNQKQIVLTSDRTPQDIPGMEARLVSRFAWGLSVDITPPDLETRIAILRNKAVSENLEIPDDTLRYIAGQFSDNIRELEGALIRVQAYSTMTGTDITTSLAADALKSLKSQGARVQLSIPEIQDEVAKYFNITLKDLKGKKRLKTFTVPRQIAMYLSRELTESSFPKIGAEFGGKDHSTVIYAIDKIAKAVTTDAGLKQEISEIRTRLGR